MSTKSEGNRHQRLLQTIGVAISMVALTGVAWWATRQPAPQLPSDGSQLASLAAALGAYALAYLARGERAFLLLRDTGAEPRRADAYALIVIGYMGNNILPARAGDAIRIYLQAPRARTSMRNVTGTVVAERVLDAVTLLILFAVLAYVLLRGIDVPAGDRMLLGGGIVAGVAIALALLLRAGRRHPRVSSAVAWLAPISVATRRLRGRHGASMLAATAAIWTFEMLTYLAVAGSVGVAINPVEALYLVAVTGVALAVPAGPGYLGTLDAAVLFGVRAIGGSGAQAVAYLVTLRFVILVPGTLAGAALVALRYGGFAALRRGRGAGV